MNLHFELGYAILLYGALIALLHWAKWRHRVAWQFRRGVAVCLRARPADRRLRRVA